VPLHAKVEGPTVHAPFGPILGESNDAQGNRNHDPLGNAQLDRRRSVRSKKSFLHHNVLWQRGLQDVHKELQLTLTPVQRAFATAVCLA